MMVHHLPPRDRHHLITRDHLPSSTKILPPHHHQVLMTTPLVPASPSAAAAAVLVTGDIMDTAVDHTATNAVAAGADAEDVAVANAAPTPGRPAATSI